MRLFFDTNVIIDEINPRRDGHQVVLDLEQILEGSYADTAQLICAWHSLSIIEYIGAKTLGREYTHDALKEIFKRYDIPATGKRDAERAFDYMSSDYEDAMQIASAVAGRAAYIVTNDKSGFSKSPIPVVTPGELLKVMSWGAGHVIHYEREFY